MTTDLESLAREHEELRTRGADDDAGLKAGDDALVRRAAALGRKPLIGALDHPDPVVRRLAVLGLGEHVRVWRRTERLGVRKNILGRLAARLEFDLGKTVRSDGDEPVCVEEEFEVRIAVVQVLGRFLPKKPAVRGLMTALEDPNPRVVRVAFVRLRQLRDPEALADIILRQHMADPKLKQVIADYFSGFEPDILLKGIHRALDKNRDPELRREIFASEAFRAVHDSMKSME